MTTIAEVSEVRAEQVQAALARYWGFEHLRPVQEEVVNAALDGRDAVVVMPTGGGKSLCFQLPAVVSDRLTVVVSPLIALMKDQVDSLGIVGVPAAALNSSLSLEEEADVRAQVIAGKLRLLYVSPERLLTASTLQMLAKADGGKGVARFAIDEAHCISAWGHDFRPEFRQLRRIKEMFPGVSVQGFTATATPQVQRDIAIELALERPRRFVGVFDRPNLTYRVVAKDDTLRRISEAVGRYPGEGIIVYCLSRKDTESIAGALKMQGLSASAYHAGLATEQRKKVSEEFAQEKTNLIVATVAFGMGIDRSNVRCVIHECLPKSMESYQQETGRAGRDGLPAECVLLYNHGDVVRLKRLLSDGADGRTEHNLRLLEEVRRFATSHQCRHRQLSEHFGQPYQSEEPGCGACDVCLGGMKALANGTEVAHRILGATQELQSRARYGSFGVNYLVSVLVGSRVKAVIERQGDKAQGFAAFAAEPKERVSAWVHQLSDLELLEVSSGQYPVVSLTDRGLAVLQDKTEVEIVENEALIPAARAAQDEFGDVDGPLFEKLRSWRRQIAEERGVPAYVVFHDATLMRIAAILPSTVDLFRAVSGVGERRANDFGDEILALITQHATENGLEMDRPAPAARPASPRSAKPTAKSLQYAALFAAAKTVDEIATAMNVSASTVWRQLADWAAFAKPESIEPWVPKATIDRVTKALSASDSEFLTPVYESLDGRVPYEQIRLVKSHLGPAQV